MSAGEKRPLLYPSTILRMLRPSSVPYLSSSLLVIGFFNNLHRKRLELFLVRRVLSADRKRGTPQRLHAVLVHGFEKLLLGETGDLEVIIEHLRPLGVVFLRKFEAFLPSEQSGPYVDRRVKCRPPVSALQ